MLRTYGEEWNGFQFRSPIYLDEHFDPYKFDLVKWEEWTPSETAGYERDKEKVKSRYCFSIATLTWNRKEQAFDFGSVGLRYLQHRVDGLEDYILKFCEEMEKELDEEV